MNTDLKFYNAFNSIPGVGVATLRLLKLHFNTFEEAWAASETGLREAKIDEKPLQAILWKRPSIRPDQFMERLIRENIWIIEKDNPQFSEYLKEIPNPPWALYGRGNANLWQSADAKKPILGVVGTRRPTQYGLEATDIIVSQLTETGCAIVSGLAVGIDGRAHEACLDSGGTTIAVLGTGVDADSIFPSEHRGLARRIAESGGAVISEYAPGTPATKDHFPQRNRIISGLSQGVIVIEAREKSGALITARFALEQNREVFALPGSIFSHTSTGPNTLIKEGAKLVLSARDILEEFGIEYNKEKKAIAAESLSNDEQKLIEILDEPLSVDVIKNKTGLAINIILASLSLLEIKGLVSNMGQDTYQKI